MTEFVKLVKEMRKAQKDFFKFHRPLDMQTAVQLEREVDKIIKTLEAQDAAVKLGQTELF